MLIDGHEHLESLEKLPDVRPYLAKVPGLLPAMERILRGTLKGPMSDENYAEASSAFSDLGFHATGAVLLAAVEKRRGLAGVMDVMADPRRLLTAYNDCVSSSSVAFRFDKTLADQIIHIGDSPRAPPVLSFHP